MKLFINWLVYAIAILISAYILPGVSVSGLMVALVLAVVLGAINAFVKPLLIILTLPLTVVTFGLFLFVLNALLIMVAAAIVPGFQVASFAWALLFSIVLSLISSVLGGFGDDRTSAPTVQ
jgi:putative membrane protein